MKFRVLCIVLFLSTSAVMSSQEVINMPERTPEQEASSQTDRLQRELNLSPEQVKEVYEINLHYARQRQQSNSRAEATERIRSKNGDLKQILTDEQYNKLQNKHYSRSSYTDSSDISSESNNTKQESSSGSITPLSSSAYRNTMEERERKNEERGALRPYYFEVPPTTSEKRVKSAIPINIEKSRNSVPTPSRSQERIPSRQQPAYSSPSRNTGSAPSNTRSSQGSNSKSASETNNNTKNR